MDKNEEKRQQLVSGVLAVTAGVSQAEFVAQALQAWERLAAHLCPLMGNAGFTALYARSVRLVSQRHGWVAAVQSSHSIDILFATLKENLLSADLAESGAANAELLDTYTKLLADLIGGTLTTRLLNTAWALRSARKTDAGLQAKRGALLARHQSGQDSSLSPATAADGAAAHDADSLVLSARIDALQEHIIWLDAERQDFNSLKETVGHLREANQNLVLATLSAQNLRDEAEASNQRQNEFLAMLAHELRNPLAPISMAAALLARIPNATPQLVKIQEIVSRQVKHLARLLDDLLDAARISSGKITLIVEPVLLAEIVERSIETVQQRLAERKQTLTVSLPDELIVVDCDQMRLAQVFSNLLVNASKFTQDHGELTLTARRTGDQVLVSVKDNGVGISADVLPHIFSLFTQGPRSLARSEGGLGVGLNVARNLLQMHGGKVEAHSMGLGSGSIFNVMLPISFASPLVVPALPAYRESMTSYRILLIEDNRDASETLRSFLVQTGHVVVTAYDGASGLALALAQDFDVLICDIGLPGLDGFGVVEGIRNTAGKIKPLSVALSGYGQTEDRALALSAGFDHYFVKPIDVNVLLAIISSIVPTSAEHVAISPDLPVA